MQEILTRIEALCLELPSGTLFIAGIIVTVMGLYLWLGGNYYYGIIVGLLGAALGSLAGMVVSQSFNLASIWCILIGATLLALVSVHFKNIVIIILAVLIFSLSSGTGYLSYALNSAKSLRENNLTNSMDNSSPADSVSGLEHLVDITKKSRDTINKTTDAAGNFYEKLKQVLSDAWSDTSGHRWQLFAFIALGGVVGFLLACLVKKIVIALCCSIVGAAATIAGVQILLMAKGAAMLEALQKRPSILPIIFSAMVIFGWLVQLLIVRSGKKVQAQETND